MPTSTCSLVHESNVRLFLRHIHQANDENYKELTDVHLCDVCPDLPMNAGAVHAKGTVQIRMVSGMRSNLPDEYPKVVRSPSWRTRFTVCANI